MIRLPRTDILLNICLRPPWRGNPLAWFEASNLPEEAFGIKDLMEKYKKVQYDFHQGTILPIGEEPSGQLVDWISVSLSFKKRLSPYLQGR